MVRWMVHKVSGRYEQFVFSPMHEWTTRFNQTDRIPERVSLEQLMNEGWEPCARPNKHDPYGL